MIQIHRISILAPLSVGVVTQVCAMITYLLPVRATIDLVRREKSLGHVGTPSTDLGIFVPIIPYASLAHLVEIGFWGCCSWSAENL